MINSAVIGCGSVGPNKHAPALIAHPNSELVAVCDINEERVNEVANNFNVQAYTDYEKMLESVEVDSIHICTPPHTHFSIAEKCLSSEVPVLIEKPLAKNCSEAEKIRRVAEENDTLVSVVHNKLYIRCVQEALTLTEKGRIGDVVSVSMVFSEPVDLTDPYQGDWIFDLPGGGIGEGLPHQAYLPLAFTDPLEQVEGVQTQNYKGYEGDIQFDGVQILANDSIGRLISIQISSSAVDNDFLIVQGTEGVIRIDLTSRTVTHRGPTNNFIQNLVTHGLKSGIDSHLSVAKNLHHFVLNSYRKNRKKWHEDQNGHYSLIDSYLQAIRKNAGPPISFGDAYDTVKLLEAVEKHSENGTTKKI